jgi:high-affinity K+ transport system ATPase subunit B
MHLLGFLFYFRALWTIAISFLLAVAMLSYCAVYQRPFLFEVVKRAKVVKAYLVEHIPSTDAALFADIIIHESSLLLMFFTMLARLVLGIAQMLYSFVFKSYDY